MSTGFLAPTFDQVIAAINARWKIAFGANADTSSDTVDGLFQDIQALFEKIVYDALAECYAQKNLDTATGLNIDAFLAPLFRVLRLPALPTSCEVWLYGTAGTLIPAATSVATIDTSTSFETSANVTITAGSYMVITVPALTSPTNITITIGLEISNVTTSGTASEVAFDIVTELFSNSNVVTPQQAGDQPDGQAIIFVQMLGSLAFSISGAGSAYSATLGFVEAVDTGPRTANYGTITRIGEPISGWAGLTNIVDATLGTNEETDGAYKARHASSANIVGFATPRGLAARLLDPNFGGASQVRIYENLTGSVVSGRPSHSYEAVVEGGDPQDIAETIWLSHTTGTQSYGATTYIVTDEQGLVPQPRTIKFSRPVYRYVHIEITITRGEGFPNLALTDIQTLISEDLEAWGNTLGIGRDVYAIEVKGRATALLTGVQDVAVQMATTVNPLDPPSLGSSDLTLGDLDYSRWATSRILVIVV